MENNIGKVQNIYWLNGNDEVIKTKGFPLLFRTDTYYTEKEMFIIQLEDKSWTPVKKERVFVEKQKAFEAKRFEDKNMKETYLKWAKEYTEKADAIII